MCLKTEYTCVKYDVEDRIARITLNNPVKMNALDAALAAELAEAICRAGEDEAVKVIVITGAGKAFCAGGDVSYFRELDLEGGYSFVKQAQDVVRAFKKTEKPIIAAVNGFAVGAGLSLVLLSDMVISSDKALFGAAFVKVGLVPDLGMLYTLPRAIGLHKANELVLTGKNIDAQEAYRLGIVNTVVEHDKLGEAVAELCQLLAGHPGRAMGSAKTMMNLGLNMGLGELLESEALTQAVCMMTADSREGVDAFINKRQPNFK